MEVINIKDGNGGRNYQGAIGYAANAVGLSDNILSKKQMTFGGGSFKTKGGGMIYINCSKMQIGVEYAISSNGKGGFGYNGYPLNGGGAGGSICINSKQINFTTGNKNYFVAANGGGGSAEGNINNRWTYYNGYNGTNIKGGNGANSDQR